MFTENANLKVDIGNSVDLVRVLYPTGRASLSVGVEFMAYALSTSYSGARLQISALDGFFGGHAIYCFADSVSPKTLRFRYLHNSAHLVDGNYNTTDNTWRAGYYIPFTRDNMELLFAQEFDCGSTRMRYYAAFQQSVNVRPRFLRNTAGFVGLENHLKTPVTSAWGLPCYLYAALQVQTVGLPEYQLTYNTLLGIKTGTWDAKGVSLYLSYYNGNHMFSEFYYQRIQKFGVGFTIDFQ